MTIEPGGFIIAAGCLFFHNDIGKESSAILELPRNGDEAMQKAGSREQK